MTTRSEATISTIYDQLMKNRYMLTIAKHQVKDYVTKEDIDKVITILKNEDTLQIVDHLSVYEISPKYRQLHGHFIVSTPTKVHFKQYTSILGFRLQWKPIFNIYGAVQYLQKDIEHDNSQSDILMENYFNHNYAFNEQKGNQ